MSRPNELVLVRHGESTWNLENRFSGWTDVPLTVGGEEEAVSAGVLMAEEGLSFDIVHTSLLRRAINTANIALDRMDLHWLPVRRSWRLNERHYGGLQGLNKKETAALHGADQVFQWRRSYGVPPPALERDDPRHPRFDRRYRDVATGELPVSECLADVVARAVPYWEAGILPDLSAGRRVLVVAHGNSIRALLKYLKGIGEEEITRLNIPTGIPLVVELDDDLEYAGDRYLGDPGVAEAAAAAVAAQAG
ncbi:MAG: 2,3-diphosphoglycerate-dependent phosphoglycerate mutase [bacterium]|nr:2,3-diphosphoglycerate-dependent phosphoglycerate mutase [bacterium]MDE0353025.1 2,3-diphosphoglycerate-dependent phosphoglycerate mutase [bacterium]